MLVEQLTRRVDNKLVIEQAAVIAALKESSLKDLISSLQPNINKKSKIKHLD